MAADQSGLENGGRKRVFGQLRQERNAAGALPSWPVGEVAPVEQHFAFRSPAKTGEGVKRERLADTVSPQHGDELSASGIQIERMYERPSCNVDVDGAAFEPRTSRSRLQALVMPRFRLEAAVAGGCDDADPPRAVVQSMFALDPEFDGSGPKSVPAPVVRSRQAETGLLVVLRGGEGIRRAEPSAVSRIREPAPDAIRRARSARL